MGSTDPHTAVMLRSFGWYRSLCSTQPVEYMRTQHCCLGTVDAVACAVLDSA
jgi:hypothetical protein